MREWEKAESPSTYWYKKFLELERKEELQKIMWNVDLTNEQRASLVHGLPMKEALLMCKEVYKNGIAKVTIQISEDTLLMTKRDFSVTFPEQLSIISRLMIL